MSSRIINITQPGRTSFFHNYSAVQFCPVKFLSRLCRVRRSNSGSLFCLADGSAVKTEIFTRQLKGALAFCTNRTLFVLVQLVWQLKTAFWVLVVGNQMDLHTYRVGKLGLFFRLSQLWAGNRLPRLNNQFSTGMGRRTA